MTREDFLRFFRDDDQLNQLSADDRREIFLSILKDSNDITMMELYRIIWDYCADVEIIEKAPEQRYDAEDFMEFLRDESKLDQLTHEERKEIFRTCLTGSSDVTAELFELLFEIYGIEDYKALTSLNYKHKPYKVRVTYGEEQAKKMHDGIPLTEEEEDKFGKTYSFESAKEAEAFKKGMEEALGWREWYIGTYRHVE